MISDKHSEQARINGARSRGPKTPRGKAFSSRNAMRHGLLSKTVLLRNEDSGAFRELFQVYAERFAPLDDVEIGIIEEMVAAYWHLRRAFAIETRMLDSDMDARQAASELDRLAASFGDLASTPKLSVLHRYQTRLRLVHSRALRDLATMRGKLANKSAEPTNPAGPLFANKTVKPEPAENPPKTQVLPANPQARAQDRAGDFEEPEGPDPRPLTPDPRSEATSNPTFRL